LRDKKKLQESFKKNFLYCRDCRYYSEAFSYHPGMPAESTFQYPSASLLRQLAAMLYDSLLIFSVLFFASAVAIVFNRGEAIESNVFFTLYLLFTWFTYYAFSWRRSGQTLGMRAWKIRTGYLRLLFALLSLGCLGLGYLWRLFKPYTWHDHLSHTRIVYLSSAQQESGTDAAAV
jgi:uncharacterized RDD family membrane protein YckC